MLPGDAGTTTLLVVPLSFGVWPTSVQFAVPKLEFCCKLNPVEGDGQETIAVLVCVSVTVSSGAPGVCTAAIRLQKPPVTE